MFFCESNACPIEWVKEHCTVKHNGVIATWKNCKNQRRNKNA